MFLVLRDTNRNHANISVEIPAFCTILVTQRALDTHEMFTLHSG